LEKLTLIAIGINLKSPLAIAVKIIKDSEYYCYSGLENAQQLVLASSNKAAAAWASLLVSRGQGGVVEVALASQMYDVAEAREVNGYW